MRLLIDINDTLSPEELDGVIAKIENQLETVAHSIQIESRPANNEGIQKFLDWCDRHKVLVDDLNLPSRKERNAR
jgi:hypothetical protein